MQTTQYGTTIRSDVSDIGWSGVRVSTPPTRESCRLTSGHGGVRREDFRAGLRWVDSGAGGWLIVLVSASRLACLSAVGLFDAVALVGGSEPHDEA